MLHTDSLIPSSLIGPPAPHELSTPVEVEPDLDERANDTSAQLLAQLQPSLQALHTQVIQGADSPFPAACSG